VSNLENGKMAIVDAKMVYIAASTLDTAKMIEERVRNWRLEVILKLISG
jgi:hypothetical protein